MSDNDQQQKASQEIENQRNERHKERMARLKEKVDARIESATEEKGLLLVLTGNGKGKSIGFWHDNPGCWTRLQGRCGAVYQRHMGMW